MTIAGIPDGDLAGTLVALGKQSGGSSPPSLVHLCSPSVELHVAVAFQLPAGTELPPASSVQTGSARETDFVI